MLEGSALPKLMEEHGFVDIQTDYASVPACWGGYIGKLAYDVSSNRNLSRLCCCRKSTDLIIDFCRI